MALKKKNEREKKERKKEKERSQNCAQEAPLTCLQPLGGFTD